MAKISFGLVLFALVVALPLGSVLCQDDPWKTVLDQASQVGVSQDTINEAKKAIDDGSADQAVDDALGEASNLADLVEEANGGSSNKGSPPAATIGNSPAATTGNSAAEALEDSSDSDDEEESSASKAPENSPSKAPELAPENAPSEAPELAPKNAASEFAPTNAPSETPSAAPEAKAPYAVTPQA